MYDRTTPVADLLEVYTRSPAELREAVAVIPGDRHATAPEHPEAGKWTVREVVAHLADADEVFNHRLRRLLAEEGPRMADWDENAFARNLNYRHEDVSLGLDLIDLNHRRMLPLLQGLPEAAWQRQGIHERRGEQTAREILYWAGFHIRHHIGFIQRKKQLLGW